MPRDAYMGIRKDASYASWRFRGTTLYSPWSIGVPALTKPHFRQNCGMMFTCPGQHGREADGSEFEGCCVAVARKGD